MSAQPARRVGDLRCHAVGLSCHKSTSVGEIYSYRFLLLMAEIPVDR